MRDSVEPKLTVSVYSPNTEHVEDILLRGDRHASPWGAWNATDVGRGLQRGAGLRSGIEAGELDADDIGGTH